MLALATQLYGRWLARFRASLKPSEAILEGAYEVDGQLLWQEEVRAKQRLVIGAIDPKRQRIRFKNYSPQR